ncbi:protein kinase [Pendulispora brunnea]|uniref:Protein kinase n=1 Tax=Pendulispora brunnea TaxID=2905690 RepID=A0ABZ2KHI8_9BACT
MGSELVPGTVFANRFIVERVAGRGGMGIVYRARDQARDGTPVALKVLPTFGNHRDFLQRFSREAYMLSQLQHPGIVAYVDHGVTSTGRPFLAMEWLDGEDLGQRLDRCGLRLSDTIRLFCGLADALSAAHSRGFVHRDVKPENIFLRDGRPDSPILLDFGVARLVASELTAAGIALGTPLYMAPEQARGDRDVGPNADVFALGCVIYKCLTGRTPVPNGHPTVVMASLVLDDFPRLRTVRPALPEKLDALLGRMLAKDPQQRPADGSALLDELYTLGSLTDASAPERHDEPGTNITCDDELQLVSMLLVVEERVSEPLPTQEEVIKGSSRRTQRRELGDALRARFDARVEILLDGSMIVTIAQSARRTASDQSAQAARCALFLREQLPVHRMVIVTGRSIVIGEHLLSGEVLDRANTLLAEVERIQVYTNDTAPGIWLDSMTAHLLDAHFHVTKQPYAGCFVLDSELGIDEARPLLGKPTPCVGRDRELTELQLLLDECCEDSVARLAVVIGPSGIGKSRLRHEFVRRVREKHAVDVWMGRADPTYGGAPYALLADALRRLVDTRDGDDLSAQQHKLGERVRHHVPARDAQLVTELLGELCGISFPSERSPKLRQARMDPRKMVSQTTTTFISFLRAECSAHPVLLVLEDVQWGDGPTLRLVDAALRDCHDKPVMVLALARPDVNDIFPRLWTQRKRQDFHLDGLSKRASAQLVSEVLGANAPAETVSRIVEHAAGNALFLEELIRYVGNERSHAMPDTVLAILQARLQNLEPALRRVLRAASVYGGTFWRSGILALLGGRTSVPNIDECLEELGHRELITKHVTSRLRGDTEYAFRHHLVREAAHSLLTEEALKSRHRAAAEFLQARGENDLRVLAEHYALGGEAERAASLYARAAAQASAAKVS